VTRPLSRLFAAVGLDVGETLRFAVVGVAQNGVNLGTYTVALLAGAPYLTAAVLAGVTALLASFVANRAWTFRHARSARAHAQVVRYALVFVVASLFALAVLSLLVELAGVPRVAAQALAIMVAAPFSYLAQRAFTFRRRGGPGPEAGHLAG
jgi:putative flippase GtrA